MFGTALACTNWCITFQKIAVVVAVAVLSGAVLVKMWDQISARYAEASLTEEYFDEGSEGRGVYIRWAGAIIEDHSSEWG